MIVDIPDELAERIRDISISNWWMVSHTERSPLGIVKNLAALLPAPDPLDVLAAEDGWEHDYRDTSCTHCDGIGCRACDARCQPFVLTDDETEAVRRWLSIPYPSSPGPVVNAVLRRLLPDERVEHRMIRKPYETGGRWFVPCSCIAFEATGKTLDAAVRAWAAHAGIGHD